MPKSIEFPENKIPLDQLLDRKFALLKNESIEYSERIAGLLELSKEYLAMGDMGKAKEVLAFSETIVNQKPSVPETVQGGDRNATIKRDPSSLFT